MLYRLLCSVVVFVFLFSSASCASRDARVDVVMHDDKGMTTPSRRDREAQIAAVEGAAASLKVLFNTIQAAAPYNMIPETPEDPGGSTVLRSDLDALRHLTQGQAEVLKALIPWIKFQSNQGPFDELTQKEIEIAIQWGAIANSNASRVAAQFVRTRTVAAVVGDAEHTSPDWLPPVQRVVSAQNGFSEMEDAILTTSMYVVACRYALSRSGESDGPVADAEKMADLSVAMMRLLAIRMKAGGEWDPNQVLGFYRIAQAGRASAALLFLQSYPDFESGLSELSQEQVRVMQGQSTADRPAVLDAQAFAAFRAWRLSRVEPEKAERWAKAGPENQVSTWLYWRTIDANAYPTSSTLSALPPGTVTPEDERVLQATYVQLRGPLNLEPPKPEANPALPAEVSKAMKETNGKKGKK